MNWDAIGAIAETLGAVGVIASLVYLAGQIRQSRAQMEQNTRALQAGAYQQFEQGVYARMETTLTNPDVGRLSGVADFDELNPDDKRRFALWSLANMRAYENAHYQYRMGLIDADRWAVSRRDLERTLLNPALVQWWRSEPSTLSPEFVALVEEILGEESGRADR